MNQFAKVARWLMVVVLIWGSLIGCGQQPQGKMPAWIQVHFTPDKTVISPLQPISLVATIDGLETLDTATLTIRPSGIVTVAQAITQTVTAHDVVDGVIQLPITVVFTGTGTGQLAVILQLHTTTEERSRWDWRVDVGQTSGSSGLEFFVTADRVSIARDPSVAYIDDIAYQYDHGIITAEERDRLLRKFYRGGDVIVMTHTTTPPSITPTLK